MRMAIRVSIIAVGFLLLGLVIGSASPARAVSPDVTLSMQGSPMTGDPNDVITYTIWIDNQGPLGAPSLYVNDTLPSGTVFVDDTAAADIPAPVYVRTTLTGTTVQTVHVQFANYPAGNQSFRIHARIGLSVADRQVLTNSALLWYTNAGGIPQPTQTATARTTVAIPVITVSKAGSFTSSSTMEYSITIANSGSASARTLWWNDTLPPGVVYAGFNGSLLNAACTPAGRWVNCTMVVPFTQTLRTWRLKAQIPAPLPPGSTIVNWVFVNYTDSDGTLLGERRASAPLTIQTSNIQVFKVADSARASPGGTIGYSIYFNNTGQTGASIVWINDTLPQNAGLPAVTVVSAAPVPSYQTDSTVQWQLTNVGTGVHSVTLIVQIRPALGDGTVLANAATVNYTDANGNDRPGSRSTAATTISANLPAIAAALVANRRTVEPGGSVGYALYYNNTRVALAASVVIDVFLPPGLPMSSANPRFDSTAGGRFTWNLTSIGAGEHLIQFVTTVPTIAALGSVLRTTVIVNYTDDAGTRVGGSQAFADVTVEVPAAGPPWLLIGAGIAVAIVAGLIALRLYLSAIGQTVIDEVFLLHRDGLLVKHYTRRLKPDVDSDILSGMLIAVQNFVNESFIGEAGLQKEGQLDEMKFGQYRILLVRGKSVIVAAVVSGPRVEKVPAQIRAAVEDLENELGGVLEKWDGDMDQVTGADRYMQDLISGRYRNPSKVRRGNH
jgi:uncharacterized repeat protein (TIGR01451 family)